MGLTQKLGTVPLAVFTDSSNNVGIGGAANASFKLQVTGASNFIGVLTATDGTQGLNIRAYTGGAGFGAIYSTGVTAGAGNFALAASATQTILSGVDNVNLAINSAIKLAIASTGAATFSSSVTANGLYANAGNSARFYRGANDYYWGVNNDSNNYLNFGTFAANGTAYGTNPKMILLDNGNVGFNTSSPNALGGYTIYTFNTESTRTTGSIIDLNISGTRYSTLFTTTGGTYFGSNQNVPLILLTNGNESARITSGGNVGIGTSSPAFRLHVVGPTNGVAYISGSSNAYRAELALEGNGQFTGSFVANPSASSTYNGIPTSTVGITTSSTDLVIATTNTERMRIAADGNILMHSTSFNSSLVGQLFGLTGDTYFTRSANPVLWLNRLSNDGVILTFQKDNSIVGTISTNSNSLPSDLNFKKNISTLDLGLNLVTKLRAVSYNHKIDDDDAALSTGFIAQELEQSLTELGVKENQYYILQHKPNEDAKQSQYWLDYTKMIPVLVKAIQEQQEQIEELKQLINK